MVTIIGGVAGAMWYNYSKRSSRVESVNLQGDGEDFMNYYYYYTLLSDRFRILNHLTL